MNKLRALTKITQLVRGKAGLEPRLPASRVHILNHEALIKEKPQGGNVIEEKREP